MPAGRPKKVLDMAQIETLAKLHCTYEEIAAVMKCSVDTLQRRYHALIDSARDQGKASLRRVQMKRALEGDKTMLVWLGKQYLGQSDRADYRVNLDELSDDELAALAAGRQPDGSSGRYKRPRGIGDAGR